MSQSEELPTNDEQQNHEPAVEQVEDHGESGENESGEAIQEGAPNDDNGEEQPSEPKPEKQYSRNSVHKRFDQLTAQRREAERRAEEAERRIQMQEAELKRFREGGKPEQGQQQNNEQSIRDQIKREAEAQRINEKADNIYQSGLKAYPDFEDTCKDLRAWGVMTPEFIQTLTQEENAHEIIAFLGRDMDRAQAISSMSGVRLGRELSRIEAEMKSPKAISKAPAPTKPSGATNVTKAIDLNNCSMAEFDAEMTRRERERREAKYR